MRFILMSVSVMFLAAAAQAEPIVGLWKTPPDRKDLVSHILIEPCGAGVCGTVAKVFDQRGAPVTTDSLGKRLFWDFKPQGGGVYSGGTVRIPMLNITTGNGEMRVAGDQMRVSGRVGMFSADTIWTRIE